jgi:hypothetical protein
MSDIILILYLILILFILRFINMNKEKSHFIKTTIHIECPICYNKSKNMIICCRCLKYICLKCYIRKINDTCSYCRY